jgi:integrase
MILIFRKMEKTNFTPRYVYNHYRRAITFLAELYGETSVSEFSRKRLRIVRDKMVATGKMSRKHINQQCTRLVGIFLWGNEEEWVCDGTAGALKLFKHLKKNEPGTFDHPEREDVPLDVILRTLPFLPPTVRTMVMVQFLTGMRPSELCKMTVGSIDRSNRKSNGLWYYNMGSHKTEQHIGKKSIPLSIAVQALIAPLLEGKKPESSVFSPKAAMAEHHAEMRANRKTRIPPSQQERDRLRAENPSDRIGDFYDSDSYRRAIAYAIKKANRQLPADQQIEWWFPYRLRNTTATHIEEEYGLDEAQAQLGHTSADMTRRYSRAQLKKREELALKQVNPFADVVGQRLDSSEQ